MIPNQIQQGQIAKHMRIEQSLTQATVARRMKIPLRQYKELEKGAHKWTLGIINAFCEAISKEE